MSAIDYIAKIRIDKARALLVETDMDIKEIAYRLGFSNQQYFSTLFKKATNMSPSSYRGR
jgi:AraC-like DNA-binding protein